MPTRPPLTHSPPPLTHRSLVHRRRRGLGGPRPPTHTPQWGQRGLDRRRPPTSLAAAYPHTAVGSEGPRTAGSWRTLAATACPPRHLSDLGRRHRTSLEPLHWSPPSRLTRAVAPELLRRSPPCLAGATGPELLPPLHPTPRCN
jgi:hypothetical protein